MSDQIKAVEDIQAEEVTPVVLPLMIQVAGQQHEIVASGVERIDKDPFFGGKKTVVFSSPEGVSARVGIDKLEAIVYI